MAYCFLLLFVSRASYEPAKERTYFEHIYSFTKEIVTSILTVPAFSTLVDQELNRLFRSELFARDETNETSNSSGEFGLGGAIRPGGWMGGHMFNMGDASGGVYAPTAVARNISSASMMTASTRSGSASSARRGSRFGGAGVAGAGASVGGGIGGGVSVGMGRPLSARRVSRTNSIRPGSGRPENWKAPGGAWLKSPVGGVAKSNFGFGTPHEGEDEAAAAPEEDENDGEIEAPEEPEEESKPIKPLIIRRKKISINDVRMARSPLADAVLPPPQRFLFVQTRPELIGNLVGGA
ncbi:hypothetical protein HK104_001967 [Borealophlyctis nickersoniae]|nr:hypothetical protein HK104_001967 [Borealophlyctis nickersoniae]